MTTEKNNKQSQDDQVLAQFYKEGAKDQSPVKLDDDIISYAANANKINSKNSQANHQENNKVSSHFGGGWKVPLSMAASVVVVFALLVQLEQSPQQLELPPIPEISIPTESKDKLFKSETLPADSNAKETMTDDASTIKRKASDVDAASGNSIDLKEKQSSNNIVNTPKTTNTIEQKQPLPRDRLMHEEKLDKSSRVDEFHPEDDTSQETSASPTSPGLDSSQPKPIDAPAAKKQMQKSNNEAFSSNPKTAPSEVMQQRSTINESATQSTDSTIDSTGAVSDIASDVSSESEQEFAPIPVEDWLLMIERLVARKDYAEAARQLDKFRHAHPEVNVEDLDAKIP